MDTLTPSIAHLLQGPLQQTATRKPAYVLFVYRLVLLGSAMPV